MPNLRDVFQCADTIVAVSTPEGASPRAIVRLSGPEAEPVVSRMLHSAGGGDLPRENYRAVSAALDLDGIRLPVWLYVMRAPRSYTRQDIIEIHTFGAPALIGALMEKLVSFGARPAGPGEFTRRAFLNGRIDLAQAEAVGAIVHAHAESEYRAAQAALAGHFSHGIGSLRAQLAKLAARVTVALDFSDQDVEIISPADTLACLQPMRSELADLLARRGEGRINSHAVRVVLFGPPNAGKSSLFNAILKRRQAIVSPHPGTTRDTLEAEIRAGGAQIILTDTAGLHRPADDLEAAAVSRAEDALQAADLALCMLDATARPSGNTENALQLARGQRTLVILNKCDLGPCRAEVKAILPTDVESLAVSAMTGQGVDAALSWIARCLRKDDVDRGPGRLMVNARQARLLRRALEAMDRALSAESCGTAMDLVAEDLTDALRALSEITGDVVTDDVLDRIFADFCIGK